MSIFSLEIFIVIMMYLIYKILYWWEIGGKRFLDVRKLRVLSLSIKYDFFKNYLNNEWIFITKKPYSLFRIKNDLENT